MEDEDWTIKEINDWVARGMLTRAHVLSRVDHGIRNSYASHPEEEPVIEATFSSASISTSSGEDQVLTEPAFISLLQAKASLPQGPEGVEAGRIIYESVVYLSSLPYPPSHPQPSFQTVALSLAQLSRALVWALPNRAKYIIEESDLSRMRTRWDRLRLLFQSLATGSVPLTAQDRVRAHARLLTARHSFDVSWDGWLDSCAVNHDDDGDEIYHDLLDVLYSTQEERPRWSALVPRDAFRNIAKQIKADEKLPELCTLAIPLQRFKDLVKVLLVLQIDLKNLGIDKNADLSQYDDAVNAICTAFAQDRDTETSDLITWPSFAHAIGTIAPHIVEPLYRLLTLTFMNKESLIQPPDPPRILPNDAILTLPRTSQLISFLAGSMDAGFLRRTNRFVSPNFPAPAAVVQAMISVPEEAIVLFSGRVIASTDVTAEQGGPCVFGLFSPIPRNDGSQIRAASEVSPDNPGQRQCELFQLAPVQDVFCGVVGESGWGVVVDAEEGENLVFGDVGVVDGVDGRKGSVTLVLRDGLRRGKIQQWGGNVDGKPDRDEDGEEKEGVVYEANPNRGDWEVEFIVEEIEVWSEDPA
ncbi:uncharacterized protein GGS22DRAFT_152369 [Annulohypoxylon maeteangense]|uniref:uncharacterized protein n=1 Tax=Annulohypoxylon maeteangense TaxID=1927788 RepID=UPI00200880E8|nr:uncharacterized protein GGS22DRAFT_152369 [Annulohypoxylon maeteangense]KAI0888798.1 hypothetical protein GGS22DRAFT_152369 [Annulohypoxylon maeteangense]